MQRRSFLKSLLGAAVSFLGLGAVKIAVAPVKEPLRIVETYSNWETWEVNGNGLTEKRTGGAVRLNRLPEPGEEIPIRFQWPPGFRMVKFQWHMPVWESEASWTMRCVEIPQVQI